MMCATCGQKLSATRVIQPGKEDELVWSQEFRLSEVAAQTLYLKCPAAPDGGAHRPMRCRHCELMIELTPFIDQDTSKLRISWTPIPWELERDPDLRMRPRLCKPYGQGLTHEP
jgi:hypothetical protein